MHQGFACETTRIREGCSKCLRFSILLFALVLNCHTSQAANEPTLVLNDAYGAPFTTEAGDGFLDIVAGEAFRRAGLRLKLVRLPPERGLLNANAGVEDGDLARIAGLERNYPNLIRVPEKLLDYHFVAFVRQAKLSNASWSALERLSVGHIRGWKIFEQNIQPGTPSSIVDNAEQLFAMLEKNRIDVALYGRLEGLALAKKMGIEGVRVVEPSLAEREMFIYLNKRHADKVPAIATALKAIKAEGLYARVCQEKIVPLAKPSAICQTK